MRFTTVLLGLSVFIAGTASAQPAQSVLHGIVGTWEGTLERPQGPKLRLGLEFTADASGGVRGLLTSIDQGMMQLPASVQIDADSVIVTPVASGGARIIGTLSAGGDSLQARYTVGGSALPLAMVRVESLSGVRRPQQPQAPFPYEMRDVEFEPVPGVRLAGTLTVPGGARPSPAVILISGSGPHDRDASMFGYKSFLLIADHLARAGIATLRYDERGVGQSTGSLAGVTTADFALDAEAAVKFLKAQVGIASDRIGIIGHSEGGLVAPMVAARRDDVAFVVLLAAPGVPGDSLGKLQTRTLLRSGGADSTTIEWALRLNSRLFEIARTELDSTQRLALMFRAGEEHFSTLPEAARTRQGSRAIAQSIQRVNDPWFRFFLQYDPREALRRVRVPVLALNGTLDIQVPHRENLSAIEGTLRAAGNAQVETVALENLNHLFQTATTGSIAEYPTIEETMAPVVLERIARWIQSQAPAH